MGVGFLLATIQLSLAFLLNAFAVLAWVYVFFDKQPTWLFDMQKSEVVSTLWYWVPYWLWPVDVLGSQAPHRVGFTAGEAERVRPTLMLAAMNHQARNESDKAIRAHWAYVLLRFLPFFLALLFTTLFGWTLVLKRAPMVSAKVRFLFFYAFQTWSLVQFFLTALGWLMTWIFMGNGIFDYFYPPESDMYGFSKGSSKDAAPVFMNTMLLGGFIYAGVSGIMSYLVMLGADTKISTTIDEEYERKVADEQRTLPVHHGYPNANYHATTYY